MPQQPLALDDDQLADLMRLAGPIPTESRDEFLRAVADQLRYAEIGPGTLYRAALKAQRQFLSGISTRARGFHSKYR